MTNPRRGRTLALCGGCVTGVFCFCGIMTLLDDFWMFSYGMGTELLAELMMLIFCAGVGAVMVSFGRKKSRQAKKYREYITIIGWQNAVSLRDLSRITNTGYSRVCDDMSDLLSQGIFGNEAYLDLSAQYLILNRAGQDEVYRSAERAKQEAEEKKAQEKAAEDATPEDAILAEIRRVNDDIADERLSAQIDRIEEITRLILQYQKEHPEKKTQLHSFLSYYLPTTLKILNSYAEMENQSIQGRNITETRQQIEGIMDKVVTGFETQLDQLFAEDRMDITSEINVLENMMRQDGLTSDDEADPFGKFRGQAQNG
ncbi:MAG: 5-bromo-4-chloroindolyl phosphate hydrolysis family protein [Oscillospiraceae bacterium]|nr:5-bromo-4-chloroindolyl phosphate hydrolysis family protein [Oscillospiraceae bacterium]